MAVADFSMAEGGISPGKVVVIPNGIDVGRYPVSPADCTQFGIPAGRQVVTFVGRLEPQKGVIWLLETAPKWLGELPQSDLLLVGDGPLRATLAAKARSLGIADRVHFAGWRPDVPEILAASTLLVLPSQWEGMPNVVLEAMASSRPVVSTDVEGVRELLGPLTSQQTIPYGDSQDLATKIVRFLANPSIAAETGVKNRARAEEHFALSSMVTAYEKLWESLLASKR
jgi:starch synthase (maltosyl-transferring)